MTMYQLNVFRFLFSMDDHLYRIEKAERIDNIWKIASLLTLSSMFIYGWMAYLGIGSNLILRESLRFSPDTYESSKFWFIVGRALFGAPYALIIIFVPAFIFKWLTNIEFHKLVAMQLVVLTIVLVERLTWIPLVIYGGLDWYVSPMSFGVIASYFTTKSWAIYFFGAISIFQLGIIWFQVKFISYFLEVRKGMIWFSVFILHFVEWWIVTLIAFVSTHVVGRWFG